MEEES